MLHKAIQNPRAFPHLKVNIAEAAIQILARFANGDARVALNTLEMAVLNAESQQHEVTITPEALNQYKITAV